MSDKGDLEKNKKSWAVDSERYLERAVDSSLNGIFVYDLQEKNTVFVNRQFVKITGYTSDEMNSISKNSFLNLVHLQDRERLIRHWDVLMRDQDNAEYEVEYRIQTKPGKWIWCLSRDTVFERDQERRVKRYISVLLEITERKELEQRIIDQNKALDSAAIVVETDLEGRIIYANDKFCEVSKYSRDELIGQSFKMINSGYHSKEFFSDLWSTIKSGKVWKGEIRNRAKDGQCYWLDTTISPFKEWNGQIYKYVSIRHEVTKEKEYHYQLERQIEVAKRALDSAELKGRFISELSHEVRNNLNCILGFSQLLNKGEQKNSGEFLKRIKSTLAQTLGLMNNVLDAMRLNSPNSKLEVSPTQLRELIADALDISRGNIEQKGLRLSLELAEDLPKVILCDRHRLTQIFLNILSNATKYTEKGGIVFRASCEGENTKDGFAKLRFSVNDTGRGIPKDKLGGLFREFEQCNPKDLGQGTGLGLSLCKKAVELMGGKIWAESDGLGSKFSFEIKVKVFYNNITRI